MRSKIKLMPGRRQRMGPAVKNTRKPGGMECRQERPRDPYRFPNEFIIIILRNFVLLNNYKKTENNI